MLLSLSLFLSLSCLPCTYNLSLNFSACCRLSRSSLVPLVCVFNTLSRILQNVGWDLPHGHSLQARCQELGIYKLLGESRVLCSNGLWAPRMPSCVPTTILTNYSEDSAPSIRVKVFNGSHSFEPSGVMAVPPHSTVLMDCMYPRVRGTPEWSWTSWYMQYTTGGCGEGTEKWDKSSISISFHCRLVARWRGEGSALSADHQEYRE